MAIGQVTVPYLPGYDFGVGADLATGSPMGKAVTGDATPVEHTSGATIKIDVQRIQSTEELERALGVSAEASYGSGCFGPNMSARFSYAKDTKVQSNALFMLLTIDVRLAFLSIDTPVLNPEAQKLASNPGAFNQRYGNMFVRGIGRGGLFVGSIRMETKSAEESQQISAALEGSYGLFDFSAESKFSEVQKSSNASTFLTIYHEGGPVDLQITKFDDPKELLLNANRFLESFKTDPDKNAVPYFVTLAPIAIADGPIPPNLAELEHAQDVLVACSKARSRNLDKANLLEYILDNQSRFEFTGEVDPAALQKALDNYQADLELVASCARTAISSPAKAAYPKIHATAIGETYPLASLPVLPLPKAAKMVTVPDIKNCKNTEECNKVLADVGLVGEQILAAIEPGEAFRVLDVSPLAGTSVPEGSIIRFVTQPAKVVVAEPAPLMWIASNADFKILQPVQ